MRGDKSNIEWSIKAVIRADSNIFSELVDLTALDPRRHFRFSNLTGIDFAGSHLSGYDLEGANLNGCDFRNAELREASFRAATIRHAKLYAWQYDEIARTIPRVLDCSGIYDESNNLVIYPDDEIAFRNATVLVRYAVAFNCRSINLSREACGPGLRSIPQEIFEVLDLRSLNLSGSQVEDGKVLGDLTKLTNLDLSGTRICDFSFVRQLYLLRELNIANGPSHEFGPLKGLRNLEVLDLSGTGFEDLRDLSGCSSLRSLQAYRTSIRDLGAVRALRSLEILNVGMNRIADLAPLLGLSKLVELNIDRTWVRDVSALAELPSLRRVFALGVQADDLATLISLRPDIGFDLGNSED